MTISDIFTALQATLGGIYVNDFNLYRTHLAGQRAGRGADRARFLVDIWHIYVRNNSGQMVPMRSLAASRSQPGHRSSPATTITARSRSTAARRRASRRARALAAMAEISAMTLPPGYSFEWTGTAYQEHEAAGQTGMILALALLFAFLFLVALYESWIIPIPVLLSVVVGVLGLLHRHPDRRPRSRSLCADWPRRADRARRQERHPDRRIRQGSARGRA